MTASSPLWTIEALVRAAAGVLDGAAPDAITGVSIDTRSIAAGEMFVALTDVRDGHEFVGAAFARGAALALVRQDYQRKPGDGALLRVDDPLKALERIGSAARDRLSAEARVIAVTGSAGKTGTKEMLRACLLPFGKTHAPEKSFNNHWGVPLTLARMPADTQFAVIEMGMNHAGEIAPLSRMTRPHIAIITNVLPVHVGHFADGEVGIANAKAEVFAGIEPGGVAVLPRDNPHFERLAAAARAAGARVSTFGRDEKSDVSLSIALHRTGTLVRTNVLSEPYELRMIGDHIAANSGAVVATLRELTVNLPEAVKQLVTLAPPPGRGLRSELTLSGGGSIVLIDESYNANPASMRAALRNMDAARSYLRRVAVLGDMRELGAESAALHIGLKDAVEASGADLVFACGDYMAQLFERLPTALQGRWAPTSTDLVPALLAALRPGDVVMIKGSLGTNMAPLVAAVRGLARRD